MFHSLAEFELLQSIPESDNVVKAVHIKTNKKVIIKAFLSREWTTWMVEKLAYRKVEKLNSVNIQSPIGSWHDNTNGNSFLVFEDLNGCDLFDMMLRSSRTNLKSPQAQEWTISILKQIILALKTCHAAGMVHNDLKPENILILPSGTTVGNNDISNNVRLIDFGSVLFQPPNAFNKRADCRYTVEYQCPQKSLRVKYDHRTDIWSLGILAYELLVGTYPFGHAKDENMLRNICIPTANYTFPIASDGVTQQVSEIIQDFINQCLKIDPNDRITLEQAESHLIFRNNFTVGDSGVVGNFVPTNNGENPSSSSSPIPSSLI